MDRDARVYVAGHAGLVGSAIVRALGRRGHGAVIARTHAGLDLTRQYDVDSFFSYERPSHVFLAAAVVGGIMANSTQPARFIRDNLLIQTLVIDAAHRVGAKVCFLGSSCIYPRLAPQPITEDALLTGPLEPTNRAYAVAKIAGVEMMQAYVRQHGLRGVCLMPTNLYGPGDNFDLAGGHVLPALIRKLHEAKLAHAPVLVLWGTGSPRREFLHVDDCAEAALLLMDRCEQAEIVNVGTGEDVTIKELAALIADVVGYAGEIRFDASKPDGTPRKLLDVSRLKAFGWAPTIALRRGVEETYRWYIEGAARL